MTITLELTMTERKELVQLISTLTGIKAVYLKVPSCAYQIGEFWVGKTGRIEYPDEINPYLEKKVLEGLQEAGYPVEEYISERKEVKLPKEMLELPVDEEAIPFSDTDLIVSVPKEAVDMENLNALLSAKGELIKKALGPQKLKVLEQGGKIHFPWFGLQNPETSMTYTKFISAICEMTIKQKKITAKPRENENPKYSFRCFLLRLGFIGDEYKRDRKILLSKLDGSSAFKSGKRGGDKE